MKSNTKETQACVWTIIITVLVISGLVLPFFGILYYMYGPSDQVQFVCRVTNYTSVLDSCCDTKTLICHPCYNFLLNIVYIQGEHLSKKWALIFGVSPTNFNSTAQTIQSDIQNSYLLDCCDSTDNYIRTTHLGPCSYKVNQMAVLITFGVIFGLGLIAAFIRCFCIDPFVDQVKNDMEI